MNKYCCPLIFNSLSFLFLFLFYLKGQAGFCLPGSWSFGLDWRERSLARCRWVQAGSCLEMSALAKNTHLGLVSETLGNKGYLKLGGKGGRGYHGECTSLARAMVLRMPHLLEQYLDMTL